MRLSKFILALAFSASLAQAGPPSPVSLSRYSSLWNDSPFTTKPIVEGPIAVNPFEDYALGGVTPLDGGAYMVTLLNKKKPEERISIPGNTLGFKVVEVHKGTKGPLSTTAVITNGVKTGQIGFDDKLLVIKAAAPPKGQPGQPNPNGQPGQPVPNGQPQPVPQPQIQPPTIQPGGSNNSNGGMGNRPPRPRVVPVPPTTTR